MKNRMKKEALLFLLPLLWMGLIFAFSAQTASESGSTSAGFIRVFIRLFDPGFLKLSETAQSLRIESLQGAARVLGHMGAFGMLGVLFALALRGNFPGKPVGEILKGALLFCVLYGLLDEIHQLFVPGRSFQLTDILCRGVEFLLFKLLA